MSTQKTAFQYLLDLTGAARIKAAKDSGNAASIAKAERFYTNLQESECVFTTPWRNPLANNRWETDITCMGRGFKIPSLRYNTGTLSPMILSHANFMANKSSLDLSTVTGLYHVYETDTDHLLIHPQSNVFEALKMTGFTFQPEEFEVTMYQQRNVDQKADGYVDIKHSVVAGRIYLSHVQRELKSGQSDAAPTSVVGTLEETKDPVAEGVKLDTEMTSTGESLTPVEGGQGTEDEQIRALLDADKNNDATVLAEGAADKTVAIQDAAKVVPVQEETPAQEETSTQQASKKKK